MNNEKNKEMIEEIVVNIDDKNDKSIDGGMLPSNIWIAILVGIAIMLTVFFIRSWVDEKPIIEDTPIIIDNSLVYKDTNKPVLK